MAEMYKNTKTGVVAELIEINEKTKNVTLKKKDGKFTSTTIGPFEKYWKKIDDNDPSSKKLSSKEKKSELKKEAEKPVEEKKAEKKPEKSIEQPKPAKEEKPKKEKKSKEEKNKVALDYTARAIKLIESKGFATKTYSGMPTDVGVINKVGKRLFEIYFGNNRFSVYTHEDRVPKGVSYKNIKNVFSASIQFEYNSDFEKELTKVLGWTLPTDNEPKHKEKKTSGKAKKEEKKNGKN